MTPLERLIIAFIILEMVLTGIVVYGDMVGTTVCISGGSCGAVQNTLYGKFLGLKVSILGFTAFTILLLIYLLTLYHERGHGYIVGAALIGAVVAAYFLSLQFFVLKEICSSCLAIDSLMIVIAIYVIYDYAKNKRHLRNRNKPEL